MRTLLETPAAFLDSIEKYTMSVIFSVVYGARLNRLVHPILVELNNLIDAVMRCRCI